MTTRSPQTARAEPSSAVTSMVRSPTKTPSPIRNDRFGVVVNSVQWVSTMSPTTRRLWAITPANPAGGQAAIPYLSARWASSAGEFHTGDHGLGGDAGDVDAGSADLPLFDQGDAATGVGKSYGQRLAALPRRPRRRHRTAPPCALPLWRPGKLAVPGSRDQFDQSRACPGGALIDHDRFRRGVVAAITMAVAVVIGAVLAQAATAHRERYRDIPSGNPYPEQLLPAFR